MTDNWQPIETAPKDGTWILVYCPEDTNRGHAVMHTARWMDFYQSAPDWAHGPLDDYFGSYREGLPSNPTHWMPLPAPPSDVVG